MSLVVNTKNTSFGLYDEFNDVFIPALGLNKDTEKLLKDNGVDPETVNKLKIPAGINNVGTFTILCDINKISDIFSLPVGALYAQCGCIRWSLSYKSFTCQEILRSPLDNSGLGNTMKLGVVIIKDFRAFDHDHKIGSDWQSETNYNQYNNDFSIADDIEHETEGQTPLNETGGILENLGVYLESYPITEESQHAWGHYRDSTRTEYVDSILRATGLVCIPYPLAVGENGEYIERDDMGSTYNMMLALYIGDIKYDRPIDNDELNAFYVSGNLEYKLSTNYIDARLYLEKGIGLSFEDNMWDDYVATEDTQSSPEGINLDFKKMVSVRFICKDKATGKLIVYIIPNLRHGGVDMPASPSYASPLHVTDHIKTQVEIDPEVWVKFDEGDEDILRDEYYKFTEDKSDVLTTFWLNPEAPGMTEDRYVFLVERALHLSRNYFARMRAGVGELLYQGFHRLLPWSGLLYLEYGFDENGMPYTKTSSDINDPQYGFNENDVFKNSIVSSGGTIVSRPDGLTDIILSGGGGGSSDLLYEVTHVDFESQAGCFPLYDIKRISDENDTGFALQKPTDREIGNMCYKPIKVGDPVLFAFVPKGTDDDEPEEPMCDQGGCNYIFIAGEEVQTQECQ